MILVSIAQVITEPLSQYEYNCTILTLWWIQQYVDSKEASLDKLKYIPGAYTVNFIWL